MRDYLPKKKKLKMRDSEKQHYNEKFNHHCYFVGKPSKSKTLGAKGKNNVGRVRGQASMQTKNTASK